MCVQKERKARKLTKEKIGKEKAAKPKYNMLRNSVFMIKTAWMEHEKKVLLTSVSLALLSVINSLIGLYITPVLLGQIESGVSPVTFIITAVEFTLALMLCGALTAYVRENEMYGKITVRMALINRMNEKGCRTSYPNLEDDKYIKLNSKASQATDGNSEASEAIWETLTSLLKNIVGFVIYLVMLTNTDPVLIAVIAVTTIVGYVINNSLGSYGYRHREEEGEIYKKLDYSSNIRKINGIAKDIRIFNMRPWIEEMHSKALGAYKAFKTRESNVYIWGSITDLVLTFIRNGIAYFYLIGMVLDGSLDTAAFLLYFSAVGGFTEWVSGILGDFTTLHRQSLELSTLREFYEYPEQFKFDDGEHLEVEKGKKYEIKLEDVSFKYPSAEAYTLEHINLTIHPGEKIAVVGLNGAGKTTLVKLICGFYDPTAGRVLLNGEDIRKYNREDYYEMFTAVFQQFVVLPASISMNVAQTTGEIDMDKVKECIRKAGLTEKIESLPNKYDSVLNRRVIEDATELSGGETQRLMLARALYKDAPIVILDEPTAALDPIAEADMYNKYDEMTEGCSSVYISHRLASTRFCDRIILIGEHRILEEGTHASLMELNGQYAHLFEVQSKYYREGEDLTNE